MTNPKLNPYPKDLVDEAAGIFVPNLHHEVWQAGFEAGWNWAVAVVQKVDTRAGDLKTFERMILQAFIPEKEQKEVKVDN